MINFIQYNNVTKIIIPNGVRLSNSNFSWTFARMKTLMNSHIPNSVTDMWATYFSCSNLKGPPVCGERVTDMNHAYYGCSNLTGSPVCGNNVFSLRSAYEGCHNLTGSPVCGPNVKNMESAYSGCYKLTGSPVCSEKITNMSEAYSGCSNLTGSPVCGNNVIYFSKAYSGCYNLTGSPVCSEKITNMSQAYYNCYNLTGSPVCGEKVKDMRFTYSNCENLTGKPICGNNVTDMYETYRGCHNLTGSPVCGDKVKDMSCTYFGCSNLTGSPVCGNNVTIMYDTYYACRNITGSPICGNNVTNMMGTYQACYNLTGSPVCGNNVTTMIHTYSNCHNLTGSPVCGDKVTTMISTYDNCYNLTGFPICGNNVSNMRETYSNCYNLASNGYFYSSRISNIQNCFYGKPNTKSLNLYLPANSTSLTTALINNTSSMVGANITWTDDMATNNRYYNAQYNIYIYPVSSVVGVHYIHENGGIYLEKPEDIGINPNTSTQCTVSYLLSDKSVSPQINITSDNEEIISVSNIVTNSDNFEFTLTSSETKGSAIVTLVVTQESFTQTQSFIVTVAGYSVEAIDGAQYGFTLNASNYYESGNKNVNNSYALCKVNITGNGSSHMYIDCINYAESNYDYGILSNLNTTLTSNSTADTTNVFKSFKGSQSASIQTVDYGVIPEGEHFIYVKFIKDSSTSSNNDSLQFKVRFE